MDEKTTTQGAMAEDTTAPGRRNAEWDRYVDAFIEGYFAAYPDVAVSMGRHEFDGKLPDWSAVGLAAEGRRLHAQRDQAVAFDPAQLDGRRRLERDYVVAVVDKDLFWLERARSPFRNPYWYADALDPNVYVARAYAPLADRLRAYTTYAREVPRAVEQIRANLASPLPRTFVEIGRASLGGLADYYERVVPHVFASVEDPELQAQFRSANAAAARAVRELDAWLEGQERLATEDFALGPELFTEMLRATELVDVPLDTLAAIGAHDLDRNLDALRSACAAFVPGSSVEECISRVAATKPPEGPIEAARRQLASLKEFLIEKDLVTIPGKETAAVDESPPYKRWNFAYIDIPGPYERGVPSIYYIAPPDPDWSPEEREAYLPGEAELLFTSVHEVWPGHFLHFLHSNRAPSKFGQVFVGYAFAEGWAHYSEEMMWEAGLNEGDPLAHIGQLVNALMRNVRLVSAIGLHTRGMTVEESERMFREKAYQDPGNARQQAARGTFDPAYLNYTMGKLMIMKLRADWTASRGGRAAWKEFHDQFLSYGGPPIPLVRAAMVGDGSGALF